MADFQLTGYQKSQNVSDLASYSQRVHRSLALFAVFLAGRRSLATFSI